MICIACLVLYTDKATSKYHMDEHKYKSNDDEVHSGIGNDRVLHHGALNT